MLALFEIIRSYLAPSFGIELEELQVALCIALFHVDKANSALD